MFLQVTPVALSPHADGLLFFFGQLISLTGTWMQQVGQDWLVLRVGMDFKMRCQGCGHEVMLPRSKAEKNIRKVFREGAPVQV